MSITAIITDKRPDPEDPQYRFGGNGNNLGTVTVVRVWPKGTEPWFGLFPRNNRSDIKVSGIHIWPSTGKIFVVSGGTGYMVDVENPSNWSEAHLSPITSFASAAVDGLFLISDNLRVAAYSADRLLWKTSQLSWNGIRGLEVTQDGITGEAWDDLWGSWVSFLIDAQTGEHLGGATFSFE